MGRFALAVAALFACASAAAQDYSGKWTATNSTGTVITLTLQQDGPGGVTGKLEGSGHAFDVDAEVRADGLMGLVSGNEAMVYLTGRIIDGTLNILLMEPGPNGDPDPETRRVIRFKRP